MTGMILQPPSSAAATSCSNQSINQSIDQSISQSISQSIKSSICKAPLDQSSQRRLLWVCLYKWLKACCE